MIYHLCMNQKIITNSSEETQKLGLKLAKKINSGTIFALYGDLGSGKTTFVQGLAKGLKIDNKIISPTFIIMRKYHLPITDHRSPVTDFYHIDLYRIKDQKDVKELGLTEILNDKKNIIAIEWPEKIREILPKNRIDIFFEYKDENKRQIKIMS